MWVSVGWVAGGLACAGAHEEQRTRRAAAHAQCRCQAACPKPGLRVPAVRAVVAQVGRATRRRPPPATEGTDAAPPLAPLSVLHFLHYQASTHLVDGIQKVLLCDGLAPRADGVHASLAGSGRGGEKGRRRGRHRGPAGMGRRRQRCYFPAATAVKLTARRWCCPRCSHAAASWASTARHCHR